MIKANCVRLCVCVGLCMLPPDLRDYHIHLELLTIVEKL